MITTNNPEFEIDVLEKIRTQPFAALIGFKATKVAAGLVEGELVLESRHKQNKGYVHGGLIASVADIVAGFSAVTLIPKGHHVVTAEIKVSYFSPGLGEKLFCKGTVIKPGRRLNFCEAEIFAVTEGKEPKLIAKASATMATITPDQVKS